MHKIKKCMINQLPKKLFKVQLKMEVYQNKINLHKLKYDQNFQKYNFWKQF